MISREKLKLISFKSLGECDNRECFEMACYHNPHTGEVFCESCLEEEMANENSDYYIEPSPDEKRQYLKDLAMNKREGK